MRLGDLDALTGKLKNGLGNAKNAGKEDYAKIFEVFIDWVSREPTISAVPVVRCGECSKKDKNICPLVLVQFGRNMKQVLVQKPVPDDFFCAYGQRKEVDHA